MNLHLRKKDRQIYDEAQPAPVSTEQNLSELNLSGEHMQPFPFYETASLFVGHLSSEAGEVEVKNLAESDSLHTPAVSEADHSSSNPIPSSNNAMFNEIVSIINECDQEFQGSLHALEQRCDNLVDVTNELASASLEFNEQNRIQSKFYQNEIQKCVAAQQEMLTEMFCAIDKKIEELTSKITERENFTNKMETERLETAESQEQKFRELDNTHSQKLNEIVQLMERRISGLEQKMSHDQSDLRHTFTDGLTNLANSFERSQPAD